MLGCVTEVFVVCWLVWKCEGVVTMFWDGGGRSLGLGSVCGGGRGGGGYLRHISVIISTKVKHN